MKRPISWLFVTVLATTACIDRARVNAQCKWVPEARGVLDLHNRDLTQHLDSDVELAVDLAVRYADAVSKQRSGFEGHGGLIDGGRLRDGCMATLLSAIAATHHVQLERVVAARARGRRPWAWDAMVLLLFAIVYALSSWRIARWLFRHVPAEESWPSGVASVLVSLGVSALGLQLFQLWAVTLEMMRLGNDHLSGYRASWNPWDGHLTALYVSGIVLFLVVAGWCYRLEARALGVERAV